MTRRRMPRVKQCGDVCLECRIQGLREDYSIRTFRKGGMNSFSFVSSQFGYSRLKQISSRARQLTHTHAQMMRKGCTQQCNIVCVGSIPPGVGWGARHKHPWINPWSDSAGTLVNSEGVEFLSRTTKHQRSAPSLFAF